MQEEPQTTETTEVTAMAKAPDALPSSRNFFALTLGDLEALFKSFGKEKFRAQQIYKWVYDKNVTDPDQMSNLSKDFRIELKNLIQFDYISKEPNYYILDALLI